MFPLNSTAPVASKPVHNASHLQSASSATVYGPTDLDELLTIDLKRHRGDSNKLFMICEGMQELGIKQCAEIGRLRAEKTLLERHRRQEVDNSKRWKRCRVGSRGEIAVVFSPSDNGLTVRKVRGMKDLDYIKADLPKFHLWSSDTLHIYFERGSDQESSADNQPHVLVLKKRLGPGSSINKTFIRTIKLGQLGMGIKLQRIFRQLKDIYVLSPSPRNTSTVMANREDCE